MTTNPAVPARRWLVVLAIASVVLSARDGAAGLSDLPPAAQAQVSARLGLDQPRYHAAAQDGGYRLQNARHGLEVDFDTAGVRVRAGTERWGLSFVGYGYSDTPGAAAAATPEAAANRVEYRRGALTEWYLNGPLGIEQGFTLASAPGPGAGKPLTLAFALSGNLAASADGTGKGAILSRADGTAALRYRGLVANDATGRELPSWLEVDGARLRLRVDDTGARYPLVVDPFIERARLTASDGSDGDQFGTVAVDGDTIVVGAHLDDVGANADQGSAYVFVRPAGGWNGPLAEQARLIALDGAAGDHFGFSVAVSGDTIVVGARLDDIATRVDQGSVYVFVKPSDGWSGTLHQAAKLTASQGAASDQFGDRVAVDGDTIVVGARLDDIPNCSPACTDRGSAYVFVKPPTGWSGNPNQNATLNPNSPFPGDEFGSSVAIDGPIIAVGAWRDGSFDRGMVRVFLKPGAGWTGDIGATTRLTGPGLEENFRFGVSAGVSGETIVVGAHLRNVGANADQGTAYVFVKPAGGWPANMQPSATLTAPDGAAGDQFGNPVAIDGDTVIVGARLDDIGANADQGSVYVFVKPAAGWIGSVPMNEKLTASDGAAGDVFGWAALRGDILVVGAPGDDVGVYLDHGSAYVFDAGSRPATLTLAPDGGESPVGTTHTVTARVANGNGGGVGNVIVRFEVTGSVTTSGSCTTAASGHCDFSYPGPTEPGSDTIAAFADTDGDGVQGGPDEPGATTTRTWVVAAPASVALTPSHATTPVGTSHTVTAAVADAFANPVSGITVRFAVTGTVNVTGHCVTVADGRCDFSYAGPTAPGSDTITAFADVDGDGLQGAEEPGATATKTWVAAAPASVGLTPAHATTPVGTSHTVMATVADAFANPVGGVTVRFAVSGSVNVIGQCVTDANGQCVVSYDGPTAPGTDAILAFADTDGDGAQDADEPAGAASKTWVAGPPAQMTLTPAAATHPVGTEQCVDAAVADSFGNAVAGVLVRFAVTGSVTTSGSDATDAAGEASFCYMGPELPGADEITAHADSDGDGVVDAGEPTGGATKSWLLPESTPGQASGGGHIATADGADEIAFGFNAKSAAGTLHGHCNVIDRRADVRIKCLDVTAFVMTGTHATIFGNAKVNGVTTGYVIEVDDLGEPGAGLDTFAIETDSGYEVGGVLVRGNVQAR
jgi:uncharacterized protein (DUF2141 family)